jgi:ABC-2 type transport system permease protein
MTPRRVMTVAKKELRTYFQSPVAVLFLGVFLLATLLWFFSGARFFARNLADVRPLFEALPVLLVFLVSAITMRQWAEEQKSGTLEVLLTLPLRTSELVLGKFAAGVVLVALALGLTLPIPAMVALVGDLDVGPVVGGYVGALLLGAAYMALGLCVSARTDNQVVALLVTLVTGGLLWAVGSDRVTSLVGTDTAEILRGVGTGSRFASVERGVLDLRDLAYYVGIAAFFLAVNVWFLERRRLDVGSASGGAKDRLLLGFVALVGLNAAAASVWLAPVTFLRADLTERGEFSVSRVTRDTLAELGEPLRITGYFSERTHPLLAPLVPQIRDLLAEYETYGGGRVTVEYVDPNDDESLEERLGNDYGIHPVPFRVSDRHEQSVVNSYFHLLVEYGDEYQVLSFDQLIEVHSDDEAVDVRLRSFEYDLTKAVRRVSQDFESIEAVFAKLPEQATLTAYVSPATLPEEYGDLAATIAKVSDELVLASGGRLRFQQVDPSSDPELQRQLAEQLGIQPFRVDFFSPDVFWAHVVLMAGTSVERIVPQGDVAEADLRQAIEAAVRRAVPGHLKRIAILTDNPVAPPMDPNIPPQFQPPPPRADYQALTQALQGEYQATSVDLKDGTPPDADILVLGKAGALDEKQRFAIDQFLMRGGSVIALAGHYKVDVSQDGFEAGENDPSLEALLMAYGVDVEDALVLDPQAAKFPFPSSRRGPGGAPTYALVDYPFLPDVRSDGFADGHMVVTGLTNATVPFASPVRVGALAEGVTATTLLSTSASSWTQTTPVIAPDFQRYPEVGFGATGAMASAPVAVALTGTFKSAFAEVPSPVWGEGVAGDGADRTGRTLKTSLPDARLVVIGSSEILSDFLFQLMGSGFGEVHRGNLVLFQNLIDWSVADADLLAIRSAGAFARTLRPLTDNERTTYEIGTYVAVLGLLAAAVVIAGRRPAAQRPAGAAAERETAAGGAR